MQVIEQFIQSKTGDMQTCEDAYVVTNHFAAIIDGATNKSAIHYQGESPGRIASRLCIEVVKTLPPSATAQEAFTCMNQAIHDFYLSEKVLDQVRNNPAQRCTASSIVYSRQRRELWFLGDCMAIANGQVYQFHKELDRLQSLVQRYQQHRRV